MKKVFLFVCLCLCSSFVLAQGVEYRPLNDEALRESAAGGPLEWKVLVDAANLGGIETSMFVSWPWLRMPRHAKEALFCVMYHCRRHQVFPYFTCRNYSGGWSLGYLQEKWSESFQRAAQGSDSDLTKACD